jgi:hypothetical protein
MIVWGGRASFDAVANYNDGGRYNPETDRWQPLSTHGAPSPRSQCAAVWTGKELLVWGGVGEGGAELNDGARYNPETDTWRAISGASDLEPRMEPTGVWTGSELIVYGGMKFTGGEAAFRNGARYRPITDTWTPLPDDYSLPGRTGHTAVWTGERMLVWGGRDLLPQQALLNNGLILESGANHWTQLPGDPYLPGRMYHAAVWTGTEMIVWGGMDVDGTMLSSGARYQPATGQWSATMAEGAGGKRHFWRPDLGIWTGEAMLIVAGIDYPSSLDSTFLYYPEGEPPGVVQTNCVAAPSGLIAWWRAEGNANDAIGSHGGELLYGASFALGRVGQAFNFDGVRSRISIPDSPTFQLTGSLSFEGWVQADSLAPGILFFRGDNRPGLDPYHMSIDTSGHLHWGINAADNTFAAVDSPEVFPVGAWTHVAGVLDASSGRLALYINGAVVSETTTSVRPFANLDPASEPALGIGNHGGTFHNFPFHGRIDEWSLYDRPLQAGEVLALYQAGSNGKCAGGGPTTTNCVSRVPGLVGWWRGENNANDNLGVGNGTANGGVSYEPGVVGQAFRIDGASGRINVPDNDAFKLVDALTIEAWVKLINRVDGLSLMMRGDDRPGLDPYFMGVGGGNLDFGISDEVDSDYVSTPMLLNQWIHVAGTFDAASGSIKLYVDGELKAQKTTTRRPARDLNPNFSPGLGIGNVQGSWINFPWDGWLDEVSLYNRALTAEEVAGIYQAGAGGKCVGSQPPHPANSFELSADFSASANPSGAWSYGHLGTLDGAFARLTFAKSFRADNGAPIAAWQLSDVEGPSVNRVMGEQTAISEGGAFTAEPGTIYVWPGTPGSSGHFGVIRLTLPEGHGGFYHLESSVRPTFDGPTAGDTDFHILLNGHELFGEFLAPHAGADYSTTLVLAAGDNLDFVVGPGTDGTAEHSSLKVRASLTLTNGPPAGTNCVQRPQGLVGWWRGEGNANDALGEGNGLASGGVSYTAGVVGQAFRIDGVSGRINVPDEEAFKLVDALTIEAWVKLINRVDGLSLMMRGDDRPGLDPYFMGVGGGNLAFGISDEVGSDYVTTPMVLNQWIHVAGTFDAASGSIKLYVDGVLKAQKSTPMRPARELEPNASPGLGIGNVQGSWINFPWDGWLDEVSLYNRALTADEIRGLVNAGTSGKCAEPEPPQSGPFELSAGFSPSANPAGPWSYGYLTTLDGAFTPITFQKSFRAENGVLLSAWQLSDSEGPSINRVMGDQTAVSEGGAFTAEPGTVYVWPGGPDSPGNFGVIRLTLPPGSNGLYLLETAVRPTFDGPVAGDTDFHVLRNGHELFGRFLGPNIGAEFSTLLPLAGGDHIDFVVGRGADNSADHSSLKVQARLTRAVGPPDTNQNHCVPAPSGVAAWWPFDGSAVDVVSGQSLPMTNAFYRPGMVRQGLSFRGLTGGSNTQVLLPATSGLDVGASDGFSIETWVNPSHLVMQPLVEWRVTSDTEDRHFSVHFWIGVFGTGTLYANVPELDGTEHRVQSAEGLVVANTFQHVGMSYDKASGMVRLYLNGQKVKEQVVGSFTPATRTDLLIGYRSYQSNLELFTGVLDELTIYRRALSDAEFAAIAAARAAGKCALPPETTSQIYNLSTGFSLQANPNGPWTYGSMTGLDGPLVRLEGSGQFSSDNGVPIGIWRMADGRKPWVAKVIGFTLAESDGDHFSAAPGTVYFGPDPEQEHNFGVIRFTVPEGAGGLYALDTMVQILYDGSRSVDADFHVLKNRQELLAHHLPPLSRVGYTNILLLAAGDFIDFAAGPGSGSPDTGLKIWAILRPMTNAPSLGALTALASLAPPDVDPVMLQASVDAIRASLTCGFVLSAIHQLQALRSQVQAPLAGAALGAGNPLATAAQQLIESLDPNGARRSTLATLASSAPVLQSITRQANRELRIEARAVPGASCLLERSSDLRTWLPAGVPTEVAEGQFRYIESGRAANRFFRLKQQ